MRSTIVTRLPPVASTSSLPPIVIPTKSAIYHDPSYIKKYRSPYYHNKLSEHSKLPPASTPSRIQSISRIPRDPSPGSVRERRLEMERLWSGGDASPPLPDELAQARFQKPKHALLFVGTGSQYVGMGKALMEFDAAKEVYLEAEEALAGFEDWRRGLKLEECEGEVGELGRLLERSTKERLAERGLREVARDGPQVCPFFESGVEGLTGIIDSLSLRDHSMLNQLFSLHR